jgi:hypothetical protein
MILLACAARLKVARGAQPAALSAEITSLTAGKKRGFCRGRPASYSSVMDVALELLDGLFLLFHDGFHQVADRDHSDDLAAIHDGQMA